MEAWTYRAEVYDTTPEEYVGFVYLITNEENGRLYVGKKLFWSRHKRPPLKGKKRKRVTVKESDWRTYTGSSNDLNADISSGAPITKTILHLCKSRGVMNWLELREQVERNVLTDDSYYNGIIATKIHKSHLKGLHYEHDEN